MTVGRFLDFLSFQKCHFPYWPCPNRNDSHFLSTLKSHKLPTSDTRRRVQTRRTLPLLQHSSGYRLSTLICGSHNHPPGSDREVVDGEGEYPIHWYFCIRSYVPCRRLHGWCSLLSTRRFVIRYCGMSGLWGQCSSVKKFFLMKMGMACQGRLPAP